MSAAARAEARRKAILARGTDRLAKLTTSARGEDAPAYLQDDFPKTSGGAFVGENTDMPSPSRKSVSPSPAPPSPSRTSIRGSSPFTGSVNTTSAIDESVWSTEQQEQFIQALIGSSSPANPSLRPSSRSASLEPMLDNPFAALLQAQQGAPGPEPSPLGVPPRPRRTLAHKLMPVLHISSMWILLAYFAFSYEPSVYANTQLVGSESSLWTRWSRLFENPELTLVPFFWAFTTLQIALHSMRIFLGYDRIEPPTLLAMALPHLPPPLPAIVNNGLRYMQMWTIFVDDISALLVGVGFLVWVSTFLNHENKEGTPPSIA